MEGSDRPRTSVVSGSVSLKNCYSRATVVGCFALPFAELPAASRLMAGWDDPHNGLRPG